MKPEPCPISIWRRYVYGWVRFVTVRMDATLTESAVCLNLKTKRIDLKCMLEMEKMIFILKI